MGVCFFMPPCCGITPSLSPRNALRRSLLFPYHPVYPLTRPRDPAPIPAPAVAIYWPIGRNGKRSARSIRALHVQFFCSALCGHQIRFQPIQLFNGLRNGVKQAKVFRGQMFHVLASFLR